MRLAVAALSGVLLVMTALAPSSAIGATAPSPARVRVSVSEFQLEGAPPPALGIQLQDGFVLGLVRGGLQVLDPTDTAKRLEGHPELQHCDASPCLKAIGHLLEVGYIVRVKIDVAGNSYKSVARLFTTEGPTPAALPIATESKSCDVCTVAEARVVMLRLADAMRTRIEEMTPAPAPIVPPSAPPPPRLLGPAALAMVGALAIGAGLAIIASNGDCAATSCDENRTRTAAGGILIGAGAALTLTGAYVTIIRSRGGDPVTGVALAMRW
jgi:hypothetical protein